MVRRWYPHQGQNVLSEPPMGSPRTARATPFAFLIGALCAAALGCGPEMPSPRNRPASSNGLPPTMSGGAGGAGGMAGSSGNWPPEFSFDASADAPRDGTSGSDASSAVPLDASPDVAVDAAI